MASLRRSFERERLRMLAESGCNLGLTLLMTETVPAACLLSVRVDTDRDTICAAVQSSLGDRLVS